jgi:hypothetical protein
MIDHDDLTRRLGESLRTNAGHVTVPDEPFDPGRPGLALATSAPQRRRPRALVAAAAVFVVALAGAAVALRPGPGSQADDTMTGQPYPPVASPLPPAAEGVPAPSAAPAGLDLWGVGWSAPRQGTGDPTTWAQLLGDPGDPEVALLIESESSAPGSGNADGTLLSVRGHDATLLPAKDRPDDAWTLSWEEGDAALSASFRGMTQDEAVAALDALQPRAGGGGGFDVPAGGSLTVLDEVLDPAAPAAIGVFTYAEALPVGNVPAGPQLEVRTSAATGTKTLGYLLTWFNGSRDADGRARSSDAGGMLHVVAPDGLDVLADPGGTGVPREVVEQVVAGVAPATAADLTALWTEANERVAALPLVAEIALSSGTLELRGEARALCLRLDAGRSCQAAMPAGVAVAIDGTVAASFDAGGTWYVGAATTAVAPTVDPDQPETESGADGTWEGLLVRPEADVDQVDVWFGDTGVGLTRP